MADKKITVRFNQDDQDLWTAFDEVLAKERERDKRIPMDAVAKKLMRGGLKAAAEQHVAASIAENELEIIKAQGAETAQAVRQLEQRICDLRADLATTVMVLLEHAGKISAAKAKEWVEKEFNS